MLNNNEGAGAISLATSNNNLAGIPYGPADLNTFLNLDSSFRTPSPVTFISAVDVTGFDVKIGLILCFSEETFTNWLFRISALSLSLI